MCSERVAVHGTRIIFFLTMDVCLNVIKHIILQVQEQQKNEKDTN